MSEHKGRALVLGGGGFLGVNLCRALRQQGFPVRAFGRPAQVPVEIEGVEWREGEFTDRAAVAEALQGCDRVYHLIHGRMPAAADHDPIGDLDEIVAPTLSMLQACRGAGVGRVVYVSSGGTVYGPTELLPTPESAPTDPIGAYGVSKLVVEKYLRLFQHRHGLEFRALRVANPFGPYQTARKNQGVIAALVLRALRGEPIEIWGDGSVVRDFVYVEDVSEALIAAAFDAGPHRVYNIGSGVGLSLRELIAAIEAALRTRLELIWKPGRPLDVPASVVDIARAREGLGWAPRTSFAEGLERTIAWARGHAGG